MRDFLLVTGANGYLGAACVQRLAGMAGPSVLAVWHKGRDRLLPAPPAHVHYKHCDLADRTEVAKLFSEYQIGAVAHTAALLPDGQPCFLTRALKTNAQVTLNLADALRESGCGRFIYCSSISIYASAPCPPGGWPELESLAPAHEYGWSKFVGEECVRLCCQPGGISGVALRFAGIHGPGRRSGVLFNTITAALAGKPIQLNNARQPFQMVFLDDAVSAVLSAVRVPLATSFERVNVASYTFGSLQELACRIVSACGSTSRVDSGPSTGAVQIMSTARMATVLAMGPGDVERLLRDTIRWTSSL